MNDEMPLILKCNGGLLLCFNLTKVISDTIQAKTNLNQSWIRFKPGLDRQLIISTFIINSTQLWVLSKSIFLVTVIFYVCLYSSYQSAYIPLGSCQKPHLLHCDVIILKTFPHVKFKKTVSTCDLQTKLCEMHTRLSHRVTVKFKKLWPCKIRKMQKKTVSLCDCEIL